MSDRKQRDRSRDRNKKRNYDRVDEMQEHRKRRNRDSPEHSSRRHRDDSRRDDEPEETNLVNFSFLDYKSELSKVLMGYTARDKLIDDVQDFWLFLQKYETMLKSSGQCILPDPPPTDRACYLQHRDDTPTSAYNKSFNSNLRLAIPFKDLHGRVSTYSQMTNLTAYKLQQFLVIVVHYLDFRQKEKFSKLRKLRKTQADLPVAKYREEIVAAVQNERVVLVAGDTGCGKSTQIPQYLYQAGFQSICCTQPRRIACISLSKRVAHEMLCEFGSEVGYQIRFERSKNKNTKIVFITEGLLLRQLSTEAALTQYDVVVLDEIHERHLHGDFLLGVTKCLLQARPELKLVLMSATINVQLFAKYFKEEEAHVVEVPGRLYPIKINYMPQVQDIGGRQGKAERLNPEPYIQIMQLIDNKYPSKFATSPTFMHFTDAGFYSFQVLKREIC